MAARHNISKPNIMLILSDQQRWDFDGMHFPMNMPNLRRLTNEGTTFSQAFCPSPLCAPSRNALAAGREHRDMKAYYSNAINPSYPIGRIVTFYEALRKAGYHTMSSGKDDLTKEKQDRDAIIKKSKANMKSLGFADFERTLGKRNTIGTPPRPRDTYGLYLKSRNDISVNGHRMNGFEALQKSYNNKVGSKTSHAYRSFLPDDIYEDNFVAQVTLNLYRRRPSHKPWYLQVNFPGPHDPFAITAKMEASVSSRSFGKPTKASSLTPAKRKEVDLGRQFYGAEVENLDRLLGILLKEIKDEEHRTIICYSSDHGDMLGDDGKWGKQVAAQGSVAVPLICRGPGILSGHMVHGPVATLDLAATFLDYAKAARPIGMTSRSLRSVFSGAPHTSVVRTTVQSALKNWVLHIISVPVHDLKSNDIDESEHIQIQREARYGFISVRVLGSNCQNPLLLAADNSVLRLRSLPKEIIDRTCRILRSPSNA